MVPYPLNLRPGADPSQEKSPWSWKPGPGQRATGRLGVIRLTPREPAGRPDGRWVREGLEEGEVNRAGGVVPSQDSSGRLQPMSHPKIARRLGIVRTPDPRILGRVDKF